MTEYTTTPPADLKGKVRYIDVADAAKMVRAELKRLHPGVTFSVRISRYAGGSSMNISWTDGPTDEAVRKIAARFDGRGFDGMIDLAYSYYHWLLPDGSVEVAGTSGTEGSRGVRPAFWTPKPHDDAELVHFLGGYVSPTRKYSADFYGKVAAEVAARHGRPAPAVNVSTWEERGRTRTGSAHIANDDDVHVDGDWLSTWIYRALVKRDARDEAVLEAAGKETA